MLTSLRDLWHRIQGEGRNAVGFRGMPAFRLLYDLRWMESGRAGGIEQATHELIAATSQLDRRNFYRIHAPRSACSSWTFPPGFKVSLHYSDPGEPGGDRLHAHVAQRLAQGGEGIRMIGAGPAARPGPKDLEFDMVHSVCGYIHPELIRFPGILTINDLQHLHFPEFFSKPDWEDRERLYRDSARAALHIICISEFTRQDVHRLYGIPLEKMTTVWAIPRRDSWQAIGESERRELLGAMGLEPPFLLFPAHCWPHKNHARLVEAFSLAEAGLPKDLKLVFTGRHFPPDHPAAAMIRDHALASRVVHLGYRSRREIQALFSECLALVFPSLFEGFGMPVAEAIIAGKPVLCSNTSALPEVAGDAAMMFDPTDVEEMSRCIVEVATNPAARSSLSSAATKRRTVFSSDRSARDTLAVYRRVHEEMHRGGR